MQDPCPPSAPLLVLSPTTPGKRTPQTKQSQLFFMFQRNILWVENIGCVSLHAVGMRCANPLHNPFLRNGIKIYNHIYPQRPPMGVPFAGAGSSSAIYWIHRIAYSTSDSFSGSLICGTDRIATVSAPLSHQHNYHIHLI